MNRSRVLLEAVSVTIIREVFTGAPNRRATNDM